MPRFMTSKSLRQHPPHEWEALHLQMREAFARSEKLRGQMRSRLPAQVSDQWIRSRRLRRMAFETRGGRPEQPSLAATRRAQLARASDQRKRIEQAKGIVMAILGCSRSEAFGVLLEASRAQERSVDDLASRVVANRSLPREP